MALSQEEAVALSHKRGRKPVDLIAQMPHPQGRDVIWATIRKLRTFTRLTLQHETRINLGTIASYVQGLLAAGYITETKTKGKRGGTGEAQYELARDVGVEAPRVYANGKPATLGIGREQLWQAIRGLRSFNYVELAAVASTPQRQVSASEARDYVKALVRAKYLQCIQQASVGRKDSALARYRLIPARNTGPKPPVVQQIRQVFDPNENRVVWPVKERA